MIDEIDKLELLTEEEDERQQKIDSFKNFDFTTITESNSDENLSEQQQNSEDEAILHRGHDSTSDHGNFVAHDDDYFQVNPPPPPLKKQRLMVASCEIEEENDDGGVHKECSNTEGGATMESYEEYEETAFAVEEGNYEAECENSTYDATEIYWGWISEHIT